MALSDRRSLCKLAAERCEVWLAERIKDSLHLSSPMGTSRQMARSRVRTCTRTSCKKTSKADLRRTSSKRSRTTRISMVNRRLRAKTIIRRSNKISTKMTMGSIRKLMEETRARHPSISRLSKARQKARSRSHRVRWLLERATISSKNLTLAKEAQARVFGLITSQKSQTLSTKQKSPRKRLVPSTMTN